MLLLAAAALTTMAVAMIVPTAPRHELSPLAARVTLLQVSFSLVCPERTLDLVARRSAVLSPTSRPLTKP